MPDVREVYEMVTKQKPPEPGALERQQKRQVRTARNTKLGAIGVAAAIALVAAVLVLTTMPGREGTTTPGDEAPMAEIGALPVDVATYFVRAYGTFDADRATSYLADDAWVSVEAGAFGVGTAPEEWVLSLSWWRTAGYEQTLNSCEETGTTASGTRVRCTLDFHHLGSERIGRGPFSGSYWDFTVRDGEIASAFQHFETYVFSDQMWEPFATWVAKEYPKDADVMYSSKAQGDFVLTERSIRLWGEHVDEYVREVNRGNAD